MGSWQAEAAAPTISALARSAAICRPSLPPCSFHAAAQAKLPVMALMGLSLLGERLLMDRLHMFLEVDEAGAVSAAGAGGAPQQGLQAMGGWTAARMLRAGSTCLP